MVGRAVRDQSQRQVLAPWFTCSQLVSLLSLISIRAGGACSRPASEFILLKRTFISARAKFGRRSFSSVARSLCSSVMCLDAERCSIRIRNGRILLHRSQLSFPAQHLDGPHIGENAPIGEPC